MGDDRKWHLLQSRLHRLQTVEASDNLKEAGIESIVLKGNAIERYYPEDEARPSVDVDIAVAPKDLDIADKMLRSGELGNYNIDLHRGLRHFDTREWEEVFAKTSLLELEEGSVRVLSDEDQLRIVCVHWLTDGGEKKHRLMDVHHIVNSSKDGFDWDYCLNANGPVRRKWIELTVALAHKYTGLDVDGLPFDARPEVLPAWLISTLERRWADDVPFSPLDSNFASVSQFVRQLRLRFPPNAVMSTVGVEGEFDSRSRLPYQLRYFFKRSWPSATRNVQSFVRRFIR